MTLTFAWQIGANSQRTLPLPILCLLRKLSVVISPPLAFYKLSCQGLQTTLTVHYPSSQQNTIGILGPCTPCLALHRSRQPAPSAAFFSPSLLRPLPLLFNVTR